MGPMAKMTIGVSSRCGACVDGRRVERLERERTANCDGASTVKDMVADKALSVAMLDETGAPHSVALVIGGVSVEHQRRSASSRSAWRKR